MNKSINSQRYRC